MTGSPLILIVILFLILILSGLIAAFIIFVLRSMRRQPATLPDQPESVSATSVVPSSTREWTSTEYEITRLPLDLRVAAWAGAVPHAFDADVLRALAPGLANRAGATYLEVQKLSFVEAAPDQLHCIHAPTRADMLAQLWTTGRESYRAYARRAARYYSQQLYSDRGGWRSAVGLLLYRYVLPYSSRPALQIEWLYHLAIADPEAAVTALRLLADLWTDEHRHEDVDRLLIALGEHIEAGRATDHLTATVHYFKAQAERRARRLREALAHLELARRHAGHDFRLLNESLAAIGEVVDEINHSQAVPRHESSTWAAYRVWTDRIGAVRRQWRWRDALQQIDRRDEALKHHQELLRVYSAAHNVLGEAHTTRVMGDEYVLRDRPLDALDWYDAALRLYRRAGSHFDEAATQQALGDLYQLLARYAEALPHYDEALAKYRALRAPLAEADILKAKGDVELALVYSASMPSVSTRSTRALDQYDEARTIYHEQGAELSEAAVLVAMGNALAVTGRVVTAQSRYEAAREIYARLHDRLGEANVCLASGDQLRQMGRIDEAQTDYRRALQLFGRSRDRVGEANAQLALAQVAGAQSQSAEAVHYYNAALDGYRAVGAALGEAHALAALGYEYQRTQDLSAAQAQFEAARRLYTSLSQLRGEGDMHLELGQLAELAGRPDEATPQFDRALSCYEQLKYLPGQARVWQARGEQSLTAGYAATAESQLTTALNLYEQVSDTASQAVAQTLLAEVQIALKQRAAAIAAYQQAIDLSARLLPAQREADGLRGWQALADEEFQPATPHFAAAAGREDQVLWQMGLGLAKFGLGQIDAARAILSPAWRRANPQERAAARRWLAYVQWLRPDLALPPDELGLRA